MLRPIDRRMAEALAEELTTAQSMALAEHGHATCVRIRMLCRLNCDARSERHRRLANTHAARTRQEAHP